ncbi:hypothetical protein ACEN8K_46545, partial [Variovorax sp. CT11-76]
ALARAACGGAAAAGLPAGTPARAPGRDAAAKEREARIGPGDITGNIEARAAGGAQGRASAAACSARAEREAHAVALQSLAEDLGYRIAL